MREKTGFGCKSYLLLVDTWRERERGERKTERGESEKEHEGKDGFRCLFVKEIAIKTMSPT